MKVKSFDHIVITVRDLSTSLDFYVGVLGMELNERNGRFAVRFGAQKINFHRRPGEFQPAACHAAYGTQDICLLAEGDIDAIKAELEAKGQTVVLGPVTRTGALGPIKSVYLRDPDGNLIEIATC